MPGLLFITGIALIIGVIVTNAVHRSIERSDGIERPHNFTSHALRAGLGGVVILGLLLVVSGVIWILAVRHERRRWSAPES